jgi:hypothetical protein
MAAMNREDIKNPTLHALNYYILYRMYKIPGLILLAAILTIGCAKPAYIISSEKMLDKGYDWYKTFAFIPTTDTQYARMIDRKALIPLLVNEARTQLESKGMRLDTAKPQCLFTYHLVINRKYDANSEKEVIYNTQTYTAANAPMYNTYSTGGGVSGSSYVRGSTGPNSEVYYFSSDNRPYSFDGKIQIDTLREGSFVIDMIDTKSKKIIWRSVAEGTRQESQKLTPEEAVKAFLPAMLKKLPRK